ncbi:MAG: prolipoprotein diacylglyceryl transferase [Alphaproteobacteria bacterium]
MIILPTFSPVAISIFGLSIRWYALAYILGFVFALRIIKSLTKQAVYNLREKFWDDFLSMSVFGVILGGRLGYVLFYNPIYFLSHPLEIFYLWQGGMSFHGGMLGVAFATLIFAKREKISYFKLQDMLAVVAPIGLFLGRIANFINKELMGMPTESWFGFKFEGETFAYHATPLYEAFLEGIVLFILLRILFSIKKIREKEGVITAFFLMGYGTFRFIIEFVRLPDYQLGYLFGDWFTMGHLLSLPMILGGLLLYILKNKKPSKS